MRDAHVLVGGEPRDERCEHAQAYEWKKENRGKRNGGDDDAADDSCHFARAMLIPPYRRSRF